MIGVAEMNVPDIDQAENFNANITDHRAWSLKAAMINQVNFNL